MQKIKIELSESIADRVLSPLYFSHLQNISFDPITKDKKSTDLVKNIDFDFKKFNKISSSDKIATALRSRYFDAKLKEFLKKDNPVVVNIFWWLNTRFFRIKSIKEPIFYELDFPDVIELRKKLLWENEKNIYMSSHISNKDWVREVKSKSPNWNFIFFIEWLKMTFNSEQENELFKILKENFAGSNLIFDNLDYLEVNKEFDVLWKTKSFFSLDTETNVIWKTKNLLHIGKKWDIENKDSDLLKKSSCLDDFQLIEEYSFSKDWSRFWMTWVFMKTIPIVKSAKIFHYKI